MERGDVGSVTGGHLGVPVVPDPHGLTDSCVKIIYPSFSLTLLSPPLLAMERGVFLQARQGLVPLSYTSTPSMMINDSEMLAVYTSADIQRDSSFTPITLLTTKKSHAFNGSDDAGSWAGANVPSVWKGTHV